MGVFGLFFLLAIAAAVVQWAIVFDRRGKALTAPIPGPSATPTGAAARGAAPSGEMRCHHCGHTDFDRREGQINTSAMTFLELDWANASAAVLTCKACGYMHWFLPRT